MISPPTRRGFTMVEAVVFLPIATIVIVLAWTFFQSSARKGKATDVKLQGVQATLLFTLNVERDLDGLYEDQNHEVKILDEGRGIQFWRCATPSPEGNWDPLPLEKIEYRFDSLLGKLYRKAGDKPEDSILGCFEAVQFRLEHPLGASGTDTAAPLPHGPAVVFSAVAVPEEDIKKPLEERDARHRTTLFSAVPRRWLAGRAGYPFWNPVPYYPSES